MKILINTITNTEIYEEREKDDKFTGTYTIKGELFIPGEWKHVPDDFDTSAYPKIIDVKDHLEKETKRVLSENGLNNFALGVEESYRLYAKAIPSIATDVQKYAPADVASTVAETEPQVIGGIK